MKTTTNNIVSMGISQNFHLISCLPSVRSRSNMGMQNWGKQPIFCSRMFGEGVKNMKVRTIELWKVKKHLMYKKLYKFLIWYDAYNHNIRKPKLESLNRNLILILFWRFPHQPRLNSHSRKSTDRFPIR